MGDGLVPIADVTTYDGTVFISYARADDVPSPNQKKYPGWITFFWQQLRWDLGNVGLAHANLWRDLYEIDPNEVFTDRIEAALEAAKLMIMILSPNWAQSEWCLKEASYFASLHKDAVEKTVVVKKLELPQGIDLRDEVKNILDNREAYKFFEKDPSGVVNDFYYRGLENQVAYYALVKKIARWIADHMMLSSPPRATRAAFQPKGKAVYLAAPADELRDAWQRLANDLERSGYEVLPAGDRLPDAAQAVEEPVRDALARAVLSVHLLGDSEAMKPDGSGETVVALQLRLARERQSAAGVFARILWAPKWLPDRSKGKRDPFEVVHRFGDLQPGDEVYAEEVTDLSQWLRGRLDREDDKAKPEALSDNGPPSSTPPVRTLLVASAHPDDDDVATLLANRLQSPEIQIRPVVAGDPVVPGEAVVIVPWGNADHSAISSLLTALEPLKPIVLRLPGGDEAAKRRFFCAGIYYEQVDALPPDRKSGRDLLVRLDILPSNGNDHV
jgi:hypothetical protein